MTSKEEYIQVPEVHVPELDDWQVGKLRWFNLNNGYGFCVGNEATGHQDVLLNQSDRVVPEFKPGNRGTLDLRVCYSGTASVWPESMTNHEVLYRLAPQRAKFMAVPWMLRQDVASMDVNAALDKQMQLYLMLPTFSIGKASDEMCGEPDWYYRSNWPFRAMREWLIAEQRIKRYRGRTLCIAEINDKKTALRSYDELRNYVQKLPEALRSV